MNTEQLHDLLFGEGSWQKLEAEVLERLKRDNPIMYLIVKEQP